MKTKKSLIILFVIFLMGNINIILNLNDFIYLGSSTFSDIPITHYPNLLYIQKTILQHQQVPLWSNLIFSGYPFAANPLSGLWYFPGWLALLFPLPAGINLTLLLHLLIGLYGMYYFLRSLNTSIIGSMIGSIGFVFSTKIYAHLGAGHLSLIYAISWTPWLLYFTSKFKLQKQGLRIGIVNGLFWGLILLADLRWSIPAFLVWCVLLADKRINLKELSKFVGTALSIGLLTSMTTWFPLLQYLNYSNRAGLSPNDQLIFSMSFLDFLNLFFPFFEGNAETRVYPGAVIIMLSILGLFLYKQNNHIRKWYVLLFISVIFSLGENIPGMRFIYELPGFSLLRVPSRFLFPFIIALSIISAMVIDIIHLEKVQYRLNRIVFLFPIFIFVVLFSFGSIILTKDISINLIWSIIIFSSSFIILLLLLSHSYKPFMLTTILFLILTIDLSFVNFSSLNFIPVKTVIYEKNDLISKLSNLKPNFRVYTPSYSISQEQGSFFGIHQVNGVDPLQLQRYVDFFGEASGVAVDKYSVTLPRFENGNPEKDNIGKCPNKDMLQELNTKYVISSFPLTDCDVGDYETISDQYVYEIGEKDHYLMLENCPEKELNYLIKKYSPNEVILDLESCGGNLKISEINYPGWQIFIDGQQSELESESLFRLMNISKGPHELRMVFRPKNVIISLIIQNLLWLSCAFYLFFSHRKPGYEIHS